MTNEDFEFIKKHIGAVKVECVTNPEWGAWGVIRDTGEWFEIRAPRREVVLHYSEALRFWRLVTTQ